MPASYDNVSTGLATTRYPNGTSTSYSVTTGGGKRVWGGSQHRPRTKPSIPTNVTAQAWLYFDIRVQWTTGSGNQVTTYYQPATNLEGSETIYSDDAVDGTARAYTAAESKLAKGDLNLLVTLGEGPETIRYIASRMLTLAQAFNMIRKGNFLGAAKQLGTDLSQNATKRLNRHKRVSKDPSDLLSNSWLEFQFGIKPIVNDVYGAVEAYHKKQQAGSTVQARAKYQSGEFGTKYKAGVTGTVRNPDLRTLQQLGITNPALAIWDLIPLSFLVDWFLPLSNFFGQIGSTLGLTNVYRWQSIEKMTKVQSKKTKKVQSIFTAYSRSTGTVAWTLPIPRFALPDTQRLITANALLRRSIR